MSSFGSLPIMLPDQDSRNRVLAHMLRSKLLPAAGLTMYVVSFFLWAVGDRIPTARPMRGYYCANFAMFVPWAKDWRWLLQERPFEYFSLLISAWVNPLFLAAATLGFWKPSSSTAVVPRIFTLLSIPFLLGCLRLRRFLPARGPDTLDSRNGSNTRCGLAS